MNENDLADRLRALGITEEMVSNCRMPCYEETEDLVDAGEDMFGRPQKMTEETCSAWLRMQAAAEASGIQLKLVSAHRSIDYQCELIRQKLEQGREIADILCVNAIPGYSEHHTGRALDLHAGDGEPLLEAFEEQPAFGWLCDHASEFGFYLSYPRDNPEDIDYEPWHWCFQPDSV